MAPGEPDERFSKNDGNEYVRVTVAVNTAMGEERRETEYIAVNLYENHMRSAMARATKGTPVHISGRMSHREHQRPDGTRGCELHVHARDFRNLHRAPDGYQPSQQGSDEIPHDQEQPVDQHIDQTSDQASDDAMEDSIEPEQDLDFNAPLPLGPETANDPQQEDPAPGQQAAQDTTAEENFESAVETAAFPD